MPRKALVTIPAYCKHKTGQGFVRINGKQIYLGRHGSEESQRRYQATIAEWLSNGRILPSPPPTMTIRELSAAFLRFAETEYRDDSGKLTRSYEEFVFAFRPLLLLYGSEVANDFDARKLKAVRQYIMDHGCGLKPGRGQCRRKTNAKTRTIRRLFKWGIAEGLVSPHVIHSLSALEALRRGGRESAPVQPVADEHVEAVRSYVASPIWGMIQVQRLTGARPGEIVGLRPLDLDMSDSHVWTSNPKAHKTAWHGHERIIHFGPRAQDVIRPLLANRPVDAPLFSPKDAVAEQREAKHARRKTPCSMGNNIGTNVKAKPQRHPGDCYTVASYRRAIARACELADRNAKLALAREGKEIPQRVVPVWHPHQLRHTAATEIRKRFGLDAVQSVLGHKELSTTQIYAALDHSQAARVAREIG